MTVRRVETTHISLDYKGGLDELEIVELNEDLEEMNIPLIIRIEQNEDGFIVSFTKTEDR